jgi:chromosome segregation ATPase
MTLDVETIVAVSLMMAVFSAVAAVGTSLVLGAGFERLRNGFEVVRKQTGFFSDAIHKLEEKVDIVDQQTNKFSASINALDAKVTNVGEQANIFSDTVASLEKKVGVVDSQTGFFSDALHKLEKKVELSNQHEEIVAEKLEKSAENDLISTGKAEALVAHAEDLLSQVGALATKIQVQQDMASTPVAAKELHLTMPKNLQHFAYQSGSDQEEVHYH